jgi:heme/copper-type cytochrome/quinol oxidase subunit 2
LLWSIIVICTIIWLLVMLVLALRQRAVPDGESHRERRAGVIVGLSVAASVLVIIVLTIMSYAATRGLSIAAGDPGDPAAGLSMVVGGHLCRQTA